MKLWLLRPIRNKGDDPWEPWFNKSFGFVGRAASQDEARTFADAEAGDENRGEFLGSKIASTKHPWLDEKYSTCDPLLNDGMPGVVMQDFKSA